MCIDAWYGVHAIVADLSPPSPAGDKEHLKRSRVRVGASAVAYQLFQAIDPKTSSLQLLLQLVEKPPVRALGDDLLRARLDHADLVQAQGVEAQGVLRVVGAPSVVASSLRVSNA